MRSASAVPGVRAPLFSRRIFLLFLCEISLLRLALNAFMPLIDPSEARYAMICRIMAESGNFLEPKLVYEGVLMNFEGKPPLCFQAGAAACRVLGVNLFAVRLPSTLFAAALLAVMYGVLRRIRGEAVAQLSVLLALASSVFFLYAGLCMTDMALAFCVCSAVFAYMLFDHETVRLNKKLASVGFFAALGLGMLVKGPVALVMAGLPIFLFVLLGNRWRDLANHAWISGLAAFVLIAAPWFVLMERANPGFLHYFFVNENFKRFLFKEYGDRFGAGRETFRGMAFVWFLLTNLPTVLIPLFFLWSKDGRGKLAGVFRKTALANDLPMLGFLSITLFWCLTSRVLIYYVLPTAPFFAAWLADRLIAWDCADRAGSGNALRIGLYAIPLATCAAFASFPFVAEHWTDKMPGGFFKKAAALVPDGQHFYFYREVPYSAYFYLGDLDGERIDEPAALACAVSAARIGRDAPAVPHRVIRHPKEAFDVSEEASLPYYLVTRKHNLKRHPLVKPRRLLLENDVWALYAPFEEKTDPPDPSDNAGSSETPEKTKNAASREAAEDRAAPAPAD